MNLKVKIGIKEILCLIGFSFLLVKIDAQSFEKMNFLDITTTPTGSRSANFVDVNGDGWDDIFFSNGPTGGQNNLLYINNRDGSFTTIIGDDIVQDGSSSDGVSFADVDNDGDLDAFMVTWAAGSAGKNFFYRNNGLGSFNHETSIAMSTDQTFSEMPTWIDFNNDHFLDLYYSNSNGDLTNRYYQNLRNGQFKKITSFSITGEQKRTRSIDWIDYDGDGDSDLFLTNENNNTNSLYRNDGFILNDLEYRYEKISNSAIVQGLNNSTGSSWADIDNDGDFDLFIANSNNQNNQLYKNIGGNFSEQTSSIIASGGGNSFGSSFGDIDNDGDLDLIVCNAFLPNQTNNFVYINDGLGNFSQDTTSNLALHTGWTFGCAIGDYDNDGWVDIILANTFNENQTNTVFHNTGNGNNWVKILCKGTTSNGSAVGGKIRVKARINGVDIWQTRRISANSGYCGQNSYTQHVGLGDATSIEKIEIYWPSGLQESFTDINVNKRYNIEEGSGILLGLKGGIEKNESLVFPIPTKSKISIMAKKPFSNSEIDVLFYDMTGKLIRKFSRGDIVINQSNITMDISSLNSGIYFYQIKDGGLNFLSGKIIKN